MSTAVFDVGTQLLAPGAAVIATASSTGVPLYPRTLPTCDWVLYLSAVVATGTYVFTLEVSDLVGGTYTPIASYTWPPTLAAGRVHIPINGQMAALKDADCRFLRITSTLGGTTPGAVIGSFLTKASTNSGYAVRVGDFPNVA
jgi:hypothetical protein